MTADNAMGETEATKLVKNNRPPRAGRGRPKGATNKVPAALKADFIAAYNAQRGGRNPIKGGVEWLVDFKRDHPVEFFQGLCRMIPRPEADEETEKPDDVASKEKERKALVERIFVTVERFGAGDIKPPVPGLPVPGIFRSLAEGNG